MRTNACLHPLQSLRKVTQNNRSEAANRGCGRLCLKTASCCRSARFSKSKSSQERKGWVARIDRSLSRCCIRPVYRAASQVGPTSHLTDLKIDHYFGEPQDVGRHGRERSNAPQTSTPRSYPANCRTAPATTVRLLLIGEANQLLTIPLELNIQRSSSVVIFGMD